MKNNIKKYKTILLKKNIYCIAKLITNSKTMKIITNKISTALLLTLVISSCSSTSNKDNNERKKNEKVK